MDSGKFESLMKDYIQAVMLHAGNGVKIWTVLNEPTLDLNIDMDCCYKVIGPDYISKAFRYASDVCTSGTLLMLNGGFGWYAVDRGTVDSTVSLIRRIKSHGIPFDIVGGGITFESSAPELATGPYICF